MDAAILLREVLAANKHRKFYALFCDFKKAFDSISHGLMREILSKHFSPQTADILLQCMRFEPRLPTGEKCRISSRGTRQGDLLSPYLFRLAMTMFIQLYEREFPAEVRLDRVDFKILAFADDVVLLFRKKSNFKKIKDFCDQWRKISGMELNVDKTEFMSPHDTSPMIHGFKRTTMFRYLGVWMDAHGRIYQEHKRRRQVAAWLQSRPWIRTAPIYEKKRVVTTFIRPILSYGLELDYKNATKSTAESEIFRYPRQIHFSKVQSIYCNGHGTLNITPMDVYLQRKLIRWWFSTPQWIRDFLFERRNCISAFWQNVDDMGIDLHLDYVQQNGMRLTLRQWNTWQQQEAQKRHKETLHKKPWLKALSQSDKLSKILPEDQTIFYRMMFNKLPTRYLLKKYMGNHRPWESHDGLCDCGQRDTVLHTFNCSLTIEYLHELLDEATVDVASQSSVTCAKDMVKELIQTSKRQRWILTFPSTWIKRVLKRNQIKPGRDKILTIRRTLCHTYVLYWKKRQQILHLMSDASSTSSTA